MAEGSDFTTFILVPASLRSDTAGDPTHPGCSHVQHFRRRCQPSFLRHPAGRAGGGDGHGHLARAPRRRHPADAPVQVLSEVFRVLTAKVTRPAADARCRLLLSEDLPDGASPGAA